MPDLLNPQVLNVVIPILSAALTLAITIWMDRRNIRRESKRAAICLSKTIYVKVLHLVNRESAGKPIYEKYIPRLEKSFPVYDEALYATSVRYDKPVDAPESLVRSSGVIDTHMLVPWKDELDFTDKGAAKIEGSLHQVGDNPSDTIVTATHIVNGFQKGNEDYATKAPAPVGLSRLIIDFSSIPNSDSFIKTLPLGWLCRKNQKDKQVSVFTYREGIFCVSGENLKADDVLRMDFDIDWEKL